MTFQDFWKTFLDFKMRHFNWQASSNPSVVVMNDITVQTMEEENQKYISRVSFQLVNVHLRKRREQDQSVNTESSQTEKLIFDILEKEASNHEDCNGSCSFTTSLSCKV